MMNLPPLAPLATAGAPLGSTIVVVGAPLVFAGALLVGVVALVLCVDALRARRRVASAGTRSVPAAMSYAAAQQR
jgi:hypothetical protein